MFSMLGFRGDGMCITSIIMFTDKELRRYKENLKKLKFHFQLIHVKDVWALNKN